MKATRILLFMSPLLLLLPPLVPFDKNLSWAMLGVFYSVLRRFPWNCMMAGVCYYYAQQLGRDAFLWAGGSFLFPFLAPLVLGFMPPNYGSAAALQRRRRAAPVLAKGVSGLFDERFPLLQKCLAGKPEAMIAEQKARFEPVEVNCEFWVPVDPGALDRFATGAAARKFTLWSYAEETATHLYAAGVIQPGGVAEVADWLRGTGACTGKLTIAWRQPDGVLKFFEYYFG